MVLHLFLASRRTRFLKALAVRRGKVGADSQASVTELEWILEGRRRESWLAGARTKEAGVDDSA
jgi:hypothetical protein